MLKIDAEYKRGILFLRFIGKLNNKTKKELLDILEMINNVGIKYIMFNFEKLTFIDDDGIRLIRNISKKMLDKNGKILTCGSSSLIRLKLEKNKVNNYTLEINNELGAFKLINI